jgi:hypothetical protein
MDKKLVTSIGIALLLFAIPTSLWAWCWIRDTGLSDDNCTTGSYQQNCCDGTLRKWLDGNMTYYISTSTSDSLEDYIEDGMERWNNVDMSDFTFNRGTPDTTEFEFNEDGINLINIDSQFCDESHYSDLCDQGILGFSGTFTPAPGSGEPFQAKESDIVLNGTEYVWADGNPIGGTPTIDTEGVIAHEAGHSAGLSHSGSECRSSGASGCGPEFREATMYWNYDGGQPTDKASLELDDIAALVYGYPKSTFRIEVLNDPNGLPIIGAKVRLINSAVPVNGTSIATGGSVRGDIDYVTSQPEFGDGDSSLTYSTESPFNDTDSDGLTNTIHPVIANLSVEATAGSLSSGIQAHTVADGNSTFTVSITTDETDFAGPTVAVTSHTSNQSVGTANITLAGTATDAGRGGSGISQVTVSGEVADNGTAVGDGVANWSRDITLVDENEPTSIEIVAYDNQSSEPNSSILTFYITYDTTPPTVSSVSPANGSTEAAVNANFGVSFSEALNPATINTSTFRVDNGVTGTVTYSAGSHTAIFVPSAPLAHNTTYTATLTTGIQDAVGLAMAADYTWSITTGAPTGGSGDGGGGACFVGAAASR